MRIIVHIEVIGYSYIAIESTSPIYLQHGGSGAGTGYRTYTYYTIGGDVQRRVGAAIGLYIQQGDTIIILICYIQMSSRSQYTYAYHAV